MRRTVMIDDPPRSHLSHDSQEHLSFQFQLDAALCGFALFSSPCLFSSADIGCKGKQIRVLESPNYCFILILLFHFDRLIKIPIILFFYYSTAKKLDFPPLYSREIFLLLYLVYSIHSSLCLESNLLYVID